MSRRICLFAVVLVASHVPLGAQADAQTCDAWQRLAPLPTITDLNAVAGGQPGLVAVGAVGTVLFGPDQAGWRQVPSPTDDALNAVAWSAERAVAVGARGTIIESADGLAWQALDTPTGADLNAIVAGRSAWVAVGAAGAVLYSSDGLIWQSVESGTGADLRAVVWRNAEFLAAGGTGVTLSSPDGLDWQVHTPEGLFDVTPRDLATDGRRVVMVGNHGSALSQDGREWVPIDDLREQSLGSVIWTGDEFVTARQYASTLFSSDGVTWQFQSTVPWAQAEVRDLSVWSDFSIMVGEGGGIAFRRHDTDQDWVLVSGPTTVPLEAVATRNGTTVAVGGDGGLDAATVILTSTDGIRFSRSLATLPGVATVDVTATDSAFIAVSNGTDWGGGPSLLSSADGVAWNVGQFDGGTGFPPSELDAVTAAAGRIVAVGDGASAVSLDGGASWTWSEFTDQRHSTHTVATDGQIFVTAGEGGSAFTSSDGLTWQEHPGSFGSGQRNAIAWGNGRFVAVGDGVEVYTSPDGISWSAAPSPTLHLHDVVYTGTDFVAVGDAGVVAWSTDGVAWSTFSTADGAPLRGVAWNGTDLVVVGGWGYIARSVCSLAGDTVAEFTWFPEPSLSGQPVRFWDLTVGGSDGRLWSFGDGASSRDLNPTHIFRQPDEYDVQLSDSSGASVSHTVTVLQGPQVLGSELYLPGVAHLPGVNQTLWRSDVEICHLVDGDANIELALLLRDQANPNPQPVGQVIPGFSCTRLVDAVGSLFGVEAAGALRISSDREVMASGRTYNDTAAGSYGSFRTAVPPEDAPCCGEQWVLFQLSQSADPGSGFRTNLGFLNLEADPIEIDVSLHRADSQLLGSFTVELDGFEYRQLLQPLLTLAPDGVDDAFAIIQSQDRYLASASVVDNRSGDGVLIPAVPRSN